MAGNRAKPLRMLFNGIIVAIIAYFWVAFFRNNWDRISHYDWDFDYRFGGVAAVLMLAGYGLIGILWSPTLRELTDIRIGPLSAFRISAIAWMGRYVPGKIWSVVGKAYLTSNRRDLWMPIGIAAVIETLMLQAGGLLLAMIMFPFLSIELALPPWVLLLPPLLALGLVIVFHPRLFLPTVNWLLARMQRPLLVRAPRYRVLIMLLLLYAAAYFLWGGGFYFLVRSISSSQALNFPLLVFLQAVSFVIGFLALFAPAGLGVRESLLAAGLAGVMRDSPQIVLGAVVGSRMLMTLAEAVCLGLALMIRPRPPSENHINGFEHPNTGPADAGNTHCES